MDIIEVCAVADSCLIFCQYCYTLEGDSSLNFTSDEKMKKITAQSI